MPVPWATTERSRPLAKLGEELKPLVALRKRLAPTIRADPGDKFSELLGCLGGDKYAALDEWSQPKPPLVPLFTYTEAKGASLMHDALANVLEWYDDKQYASKDTALLPFASLRDKVRLEWHKRDGLENRINQEVGLAFNHAQDPTPHPAVCDGGRALYQFLQALLVGN